MITKESKSFKEKQDTVRLTPIRHLVLTPHLGFTAGQYSCPLFLEQARDNKSVTKEYILLGRKPNWKWGENQIGKGELERSPIVTITTSVDMMDESVWRWYGTTQEMTIRSCRPALASEMVLSKILERRMQANNRVPCDGWMCLRGNTNASFPCEEGVVSDGFERDEPSMDNVSEFVDYNMHPRFVCAANH